MSPSLARAITPWLRLKNKKDGDWSAKSLASDAVPGTLDLRKRDHAARLAVALENISL